MEYDAPESTTNGTLVAWLVKVVSSCRKTRLRSPIIPRTTGSGERLVTIGTFIGG